MLHAPNYRLVEAYVKEKVNQQPSSENASFNNGIAMNMKFNRNGLLGDRNALHNQIKELENQLSYDQATCVNRPSLFDQLGREQNNDTVHNSTEDPQDMLNDKTIHPSGTQQEINPYIPTDGTPMNTYDKRQPLYARIYNEWSLGKTVILVVILLGVFYLLLNLILQNRLYHMQYSTEGDMNIHRFPEPMNDSD